MLYDLKIMIKYWAEYQENDSSILEKCYFFARTIYLKSIL